MSAPRGSIERDPDRWAARTLLIVAAATAALMFAYESVKQWIFPGIGIWQSHAITIGVVTALAVVVAWRATRRLTRLNASLDRLVAERDAEVAGLQRSEAGKDAILSSSLDCIISIDHHARITEFNQAAERTFGLTRADALGRDIGDTIVPPSLRAEHRAGFARYLATGQANVLGRRIEITGARADGTEFPVEIAIARVGVPGPPSFTAYLRDITDRRRLEEQVRRSQKMEAIGRLAGGIAHDFNNILTVIVGHCSELVRANRSGAEVAGDVTAIQAAAERAATLTGQLLAFSRKQVLQPSPLELDAVVTDLDRMLRRIVTETIEMVVVTEPDIGVVKADRGQVEQVIVNLVVNARDAMPNGGTLTVRTANVELGDLYRQEHADVSPGRYVMLAVSDTGTGMDAETQAKIFEPFFTTKEVGKGTGLGLSIVHGIVTQSGGHVWVYSEPGKGTAVKVYFPRIESPADRPRPPLRAAAGRRGTETVLLVEDDPQLRRLATATVGSYGYRVLAAESGDAAEVLWRAHPGAIDLLLTDVVMPGMNGWDLAKRLRSDRPQLRVIFMSGYTEHAIVPADDGEVVFLQKPFAPSVLTATIREVLDAPPPIAAAAPPTPPPGLA